MPPYSDKAKTNNYHQYTHTKESHTKSPNYEPADKTFEIMAGRVTDRNGEHRDSYPKVWERLRTGNDDEEVIHFLLSNTRRILNFCSQIANAAVQ